MKITVILFAFILFFPSHILLSQTSGLWQPTGLQGSSIQALHLINGQSSALLASTPDAIYYSSDLGASWHLSSGLPAGTSAKAFDSRGSAYNDAFAATNRGFYRSTNFGASWSPANGSGVTINSFSFIDQNNAWAVGSDNSVARTTDAGLTWSVIITGNNNNSLDYKNVVFRKNINTIGYTIAVAVSGSNNNIYYAYNDGQKLSWTEYQLRYKSQGGSVVNADASERYNSIFLVDTLKGWVVGSNGRIYKTYMFNKYDAVFEPRHIITTNNFYGIFFTDSSNGWVVGSGGSIYRTTNSGNSWSPQSGNTTNNLKALYFTSSGQGWIAGSSGTILFTSNYGSSWSVQASSTTENLNAIKYISPGTLIAVGNNGTIIKTTNSGALWFNVSSPASTLNLTDIASSGSDLLITGQNQVLLKSTDSGVNWSSLTTLASVQFAAKCSLEYSDVIAVSIPANTDFIYACTSSRLVRSTDNGQNWRTMAGFTGTYFCLVSFIISDHLITCIGTSNGIRRIYSTETISSEINDSKVQKKSIKSISFNPSNKRILAGTSADSLFYCTYSASPTWSNINIHTGLPSPPPSINSIIPSPYGGNSFIMGTSQGVFDNSSGSWVNKSSVCINGKNVSSLAGVNNILFAGSSSPNAQTDNGIYKNVPSIAAVLSAPADNAVKVPLSPVLKWFPVPCASSYEIMYSTAPDFSSGAITIPSVTDTFALVSGLEYSTNYYWKVRPVFENSISGSFSQAARFTTRANTRILTVRAFPESGGSININPAMSEYAFGSDVVLSASPGAGYVFNGWSGDLGSAATSDNPLRLRMDMDRAISASFMPVSDMALWLCASSLSLPGGSPVAEWVNTASPGLNACMPQPGRQPVLVTNCVNSRPAVRFSADQAFVGRSDVLSIDYSQGSLLNQPSSKSIFIVFKPSNITASRQVLFESGSNVSGFNIYIANDNLVFGLYNRYERKFWHCLAPLGSAWHLAQMEYDAQANIFRAVLDGSASDWVSLKSGLQSYPDPSGIGGFSGSTRFHDYNIKSDYGRTFDGLIAAILVFNSCNAPVINDAFSCLSSSYGLDFSYSFNTDPLPRIADNLNWLIDQQYEPGDTDSAAVSPNPFSGLSYLKFRLVSQSFVDARLYDALGNEVSRLFYGPMQPGENSLAIDGCCLDPGFYFYRLLAGDNILTGKVVVVK